MSLPPSLQAAIARTLEAAGDPGPIDQALRIGGGDICEAAQVTTSRGVYFLKWHTNPPPRFFECEGQGLGLLADSGVVRVPAVVGYGQVPGEKTGYLLLEWIEGSRRGSDRAGELLGRQLARMHRDAQHTQYGLDHDNYLGRLPQPNTPDESWVAFYRDRRLGAQHDMAAQRGLLPPERARRLDNLMARLDDLIDETQCAPALLHGDLWGGNWMVSAEGEPVLIDPAVYYGDREADLAMTALFGGFPPAFYAAYQEVYPLTPGHEERQPMYKLYYVLAHLNLFGEAYGGSVDSILRRYVG